MDPRTPSSKLAELGAAGVTFHDDDLVPFGSDDSARQEIESFRQALDETGLSVPMATTNLFTHPVFKDGGFTANDRDVRRYALAKVVRNIDLAAELGAQDLRLLGRTRRCRVRGPRRTSRAALDRYAEAMNLLCEYVVEQGYDLRFALEPKPNEPRGDILLPTIGHALAFIERLDAAPRWSASTPRSVTRRWPGSTSPTAWRRRSGTASSSTST